MYSYLSSLVSSNKAAKCHPIDAVHKREKTSQAVTRMLREFTDYSVGWAQSPSQDTELKQFVSAQITSFLGNKVDNTHRNKTTNDALDKLISEMKLRASLCSMASKEAIFYEAAMAAAQQCRSETADRMATETGALGGSTLAPFTFDAVYKPEPTLWQKDMSMIAIPQKHMSFRESLLEDIHDMHHKIHGASNDFERLKVMNNVLNSLSSDESRQVRYINNSQNPLFKAETLRLMKIEIDIEALARPKDPSNMVARFESLRTVLKSIQGPPESQDAAVLWVLEKGRHSEERIDDVAQLMRANIWVTQFESAQTNMAKMQLLFTIAKDSDGLELLRQVLPENSTMLKLIGMVDKIPALVDTQIVIPTDRNEVLANLNRIKIFLGKDWKSTPESVKAIVPMVMEYYNEKISNASPDRSEDLIQLKFAFASAMISATKGNDGELWETYLPKPAEFGLMKGYSKRDRAMARGKLRPQTDTTQGRLLADNRKELGKGTFGKVKTATIESDNKQFALKRINLKSSGHDFVDYEMFCDMAKEANFGRRFSAESPHLLGVEDVYVYDDGKPVADKYGNRAAGTISKCAMLMEIGGADGIAVMGKKYTPSDNVIFMMQLATGLAAMHNMNLAHNDFKLGNSLLGADNKAKVMDFGFVVPTQVRSSTLYPTWKVGGTFPSPEALRVRNGLDHISTIDFSKVDVYAFGKALKEMAATTWLGVDPQLAWKSLDSDVIVRLEKTDPLQKMVANLIQACVEPDPANRPSMDLVVQFLESSVSTPATPTPTSTGRPPL